MYLFQMAVKLAVGFEGFTAYCTYKFSTGYFIKWFLGDWRSFGND